MLVNRLRRRRSSPRTIILHFLHYLLFSLSFYTGGILVVMLMWVEHAARQSRAQQDIEASMNETQSEQRRKRRKWKFINLPESIMCKTKERQTLLTYEINLLLKITRHLSLSSCTAPSRALNRVTYLSTAIIIVLISPACTASALVWERINDDRGRSHATQLAFEMQRY